MKASPVRYKSLSPSDLGLGSAIVIAVTAVWFTGNFHSLHDGDSLVHPLNSLYQWTIFVWEYDHAGSLLSLLTQFITRPYLNVLAISTISSFLLLGGLALWGCQILPISFTESSLWVILLIPLILTKDAIFQLASHSVTSGSAMFFSGCFVFALQKYIHSQKGHLTIPILFGLAFLATYLSKIMYIPMVTITIGLLWTQKPRLPWQSILVISITLGLVLLGYQLLEQTSLYRKDYTLQLANLPTGLPRLLTSLASKKINGFFWLAAPIIFAHIRFGRRNPLFFSLFVGVIIQTLIVACSRWAAINGYTGHYLYDLGFLSIFSTMGIGVNLCRSWLPGGKLHYVYVALGIIAIGLNAHMWNSFQPTNPLTRMEQTLGTDTPDIVAAKCDLIVGDYWSAWPAMLAANDYYYRNDIFDAASHQPRRVYAISYLAASIKHLWRPILDQPGARICSLANDEAGYKRSLSIYAPDIALQTVPVFETGNVVVHYVQHEILPATSISLEFDQFVPGKGWSYGETTPNGVTFQWMDSTEATIVLPAMIDQDLRIEFQILDAFLPDILHSLNLTVNDDPITLKQKTTTPDAVIFEGTIPHTILANNPHNIILAFHINHTFIPHFELPNSDDMRTLGLAFDWLHIEKEP